ncbi:aminotransferase class V-fold PLP-dependent enzyme [Pseudoalteromonas obscura]|uniref:Aminotransferase class V-fold PLP-dependent enzyme n=1 Tax=Pseudoalteromonas obscura TaxID=3048491 RepID=A0ABT7ERP5_9GAMM|nr:aminotransferase class V-fold PLP-dependent enzyme [Pseudoalteromonas sp. P94(2023)]MDK2597704.1 aminotransferase class V-fold PLP-dependent enzyme [Pseudoalteromonas sp. P94(2023)]
MQAEHFFMPQGTYLLSHSVGRMLKSAPEHFHSQFMQPWQVQNREPWAQWLDGIMQFNQALAKLLNGHADNFCPQTNLSSGLTKWLMGMPSLRGRRIRVLLSEDDFPSMGFVLQQALEDVELCFIPAGEDVSAMSTWQSHLTAHFDLVFVSHVYSNTGHQAPVAEIVSLAKQHQCKVIVDIAQSAGILAIDLAAWQADCVLGSCVKWLCGGPGAGFLWVSPASLADCAPKDVGWFSHQDPFEFDIHHFAAHDTALRFWGGTPSVAPYVMAAHSIDTLCQFGIENIRHHNLALLERIWQALPSRCISSPQFEKRCSGTAIVNVPDDMQECLHQLSQQGIAVDARRYGLRISPHVYNDKTDIERFIAVIKSVI